MLQSKNDGLSTADRFEAEEFYLDLHPVKHPLNLPYLRDYALTQNDRLNESSSTE